MSTWAAQVHKLKRLLRRRGRSPEDAEDLVQEAFLRLHAFLNEGHEVQRPESFLVRTALNLSADQRRRERREHLEDFLPETVEDLPLIDLGPTPEEIFSAEKRLIQIRQVLDTKTSVKTREVFLLHRLEGLTHDEIAVRMNMSLRMVEKHIARAVTVIWMERNKE